MFRFAIRFVLISCSLATFISLAGCGAPRARTPAPDLSKLEPIAYGTTIFYGTAGEGSKTKLTGWAQTEWGFTWSDGIGASLAIRVPTTTDPVELHIKMAGMNVPGRVKNQRVDLYVNAEKLARWQVADEGIFTVTVPASFVAEPNPLLIIDFYMPGAISPLSAGTGSDRRRLGVRLAEVTISKTSPDGTAAEAPPEDPP